jgi:hypothetical protein
MVHAAVNLPDAGSPTGNGIKVDSRYLKLNLDALGPQHDARKPGYLRGRLKWPEGPREVEPVAKLTVYDRFAAKAVRHFYEDRPYRPANLAKHAIAPRRNDLESLALLRAV